MRLERSIPGATRCRALPTTLLILGFLLLALVSLVTADAMGTPRKLSLLELRPLLSYLLVFPLVSAARSWAQLRAWDRGAPWRRSAQRGHLDHPVRTWGGQRCDFHRRRVTSRLGHFPLPHDRRRGALALRRLRPVRRPRWATLCLAAVVLTGLFFTLRGPGSPRSQADSRLWSCSARRTRGRPRLGRCRWSLSQPVGVGFNSLSDPAGRESLSAGLDRLTSRSVSTRDDVSSSYRHRRVE